MKLTRWMTVLLVTLAMVAPMQTSASPPDGELVVAPGAPPQRPAPLTDDQHAMLEALCAEPPHDDIRDIHAAMSEEQAELLSEEQRRFLVNASAPAFYISLAGGILAVLIAAAPL